MSRRETSGIQHFDWMTFSLFLSLVGIGWLMIYAAGYNDSEPTSPFDLKTSAGKQALFIGISSVIFLFTTIIDWKFWRTFAYLIYGFAMVKLLGVVFLGKTIKGATSWYSLGSFTYQPSEFAKFACCIAIASFLSTYNTNLRDIKTQFTAFGLIALPMFLILLQPDAGSALVFLSFFILLYRNGLSENLYIVGAVVASLLILGLMYNPLYVILGMIIFSVFVLIFNLKEKLYWLLGFLVLTGASFYIAQFGFLKLIFAVNLVALIGFSIFQWKERKTKLVQILFMLLTFGSAFTYGANYAFENFLESHQKDRIYVWLKPEKCDKAGSLYNLLQSKMTIASGGLEGKGFLEGTLTKGNYVPEQSTDFIYCTVGEEQGFIGSVGIIGLFLLLLLRIITIAERQRSDFSRHYAYGVAGIIFIHFFINIGMTMGLVPIIGIPLPFISYGGSSLLGFTLLIGVLLKLDSNRLIG